MSCLTPAQVRCFDEPRKKSEFLLGALVPEHIQTVRSEIFYSNMMKYEVIKSKLPSKWPG